MRLGSNPCALNVGCEEISGEEIRRVISFVPVERTNARDLSGSAAPCRAGRPSFKRVLNTCYVRFPSPFLSCSEELPSPRCAVRWDIKRYPGATARVGPRRSCERRACDAPSDTIIPWPTARSPIAILRIIAINIQCGTRASRGTRAARFTVVHSFRGSESSPRRVRRVGFTCSPTVTTRQTIGKRKRDRDRENLLRACQLAEN